MKSYGSIRLGKVLLPWRGIECWGVPVALYLQSDATAGLSANVILLPAFVITVMLVANNVEQILLTLRHRPLITFLFVLPFLSVTWSTSGSISLRRAIALSLSMALAYVIAIRFTPRQFLFVIVAALFPALLVSLVLLVVAPSTVRMPDGSISGLFSHKNLLGWHAAVALVAGALLTWEGAVSRRLGLVVVATSVGGLLASGSATGLLSALAALVLVAFYCQLKRLKGAGRVALILLTLHGAGAAYLIGSEIVVPSLAALGKDTSLTGRVPMWRLEDEAIAQRPLLGYGYQAFWSDGSSAGWKIKAEIDWGSPNAHSGYRDILLSFGLLGFFPFMVFVGRTLVKGARLHIAAPDGSWLGLNVLIGMLLTINISESIFYMPYNFLFIMFVAALLMIAIRRPGFYARRQDVAFPATAAELSYSRR